MNCSTYRNQQNVRSFIKWANPIVGGDRPLIQQWKSRKFGDWKCSSIYDAYLRFNWPFSVTLPGDDRRTRGSSFEENRDVLTRLKTMLRDSVASGNTDTFLKASVAVVQWGGVYSNGKRLHALGENALSQLSLGAEQLALGSADTDNLSLITDMNSGFSKIYSLMVDGLPIYDSRVACALGYLICSYCQENGLKEVPPELAIGLPLHRAGTDRNPSVGPIRFPKLAWGERKTYALSNLKAAWLLKPLAQQGAFGELPTELRLLALQSALFMIGYEVPGNSGL